MLKNVLFSNSKRNLKNVDKKSTSDPYARVFLLPDEKPTFKRKTKIIKNNLSPYWQETFDYPMKLEKALTKNLVINLKDDAGIFEKPDSKFLGEVFILCFIGFFKSTFSLKQNINFFKDTIKSQVC